MPSMLHEYVGSWLIKNMMKAAMEGLISDVWNHTMGMVAARGMLLAVLWPDTQVFLTLVTRI